MKPIFLATFLTLCAACMPVVELAPLPAPTAAGDLPADTPDRAAQITALAIAMHWRPVDRGRDVCVGARYAGRTATPDSVFLAAVDPGRRLFAIGRCPLHTVRDTMVVLYGGFRHGYAFDRPFRPSPITFTVSDVVDRGPDSHVITVRREERSYAGWIYACIIYDTPPHRDPGAARISLAPECREGGWRT